jgi:hypothetical protein
MHTDIFKAEQEMRKRQQDYDDYKRRTESARINAGMPSLELATMGGCIAGMTITNGTMTIIDEPNKKLLLLRRKK